MRNRRDILGIRWFDYVANAEVKDRTHLKDKEPKIRHRRPFGHVARMQSRVPAHDTLWTALGVRIAVVPFYIQAGSDPAGSLKPLGLTAQEGPRWNGPLRGLVSGYGYGWMEVFRYEPLLLSL